MIPSRGFTLLELVMVIVLIGIISVYAAPKLGGLGIYSLRGASQDLIKAIRYAQMQSMHHSGADHYQIVLTNNGFTVTQAGANITDPVTGANSYSQDGQYWGSVTTDSTATISFNSRGAPCDVAAPCDISVDPAANTVITLTGGDGDTQAVTIERWTGYAY